MRIGEFTNRLNTTKDTVRHYEELNLLKPAWENHAKIYGEKELTDFQVIIELKEYGLNLKDIQGIFALKEALNCGDKALINQVFDQLMGQVAALIQEEEEIRNRRVKLERELTELKRFL